MTGIFAAWAMLFKFDIDVLQKGTIRLDNHKQLPNPHCEEGTPQRYGCGHFVEL